MQAARSPEDALAYGGDSDGDGDESEFEPPECQVPAARAERPTRSPPARMGGRLHGAHWHSAAQRALAGRAGPRAPSGRRAALASGWAARMHAPARRS